MKANLFIELNESKQTGYVTIESMMHECDIEAAYSDHIEFAKKFTNSRTECLEGYKLSYIFLTVEYNGRKKKISEDDVMNALVKQGLIKQIGTETTIFGGYYVMTDELKDKMQDQLYKRKVLAGVA